MTVHTDTYNRTRVSYGGGMIDALRLRHKVVENLPDLVVCPRDQKDIEAIVKYCDESAYRFMWLEATPASRVEKRRSKAGFAWICVYI